MEGTGKRDTAQSAIVPRRPEEKNLDLDPETPHELFIMYFKEDMMNRICKNMELFPRQKVVKLCFGSYIYKQVCSNFTPL